MSGTPPPGTPPPEVPEEFAAAYRAAYERALAEQTDAPRHRSGPGAPGVGNDGPEGSGDESGEDADSWAHRLPPRPGRLLSGTHRDDAESPVSPASSRQRLSDTGWFVPMLLLLIVLLLVVGAFALGRVFAASVGASSAPPQVSSSSVTGPSLTRASSI
ncbi:hypothetical protein [Nocardioides aequoreus]|uniref:hypothetical protein n=1 Tax=Nocardioides aequoreus TaxID=397278 RepID=UPI0004C32674|nr:hypothetical protein [Nocardioides aequoreus]